MGCDPVTLGGSRVLVLGMGVTGRAAASALTAAGATVVTVDATAPADVTDVRELDLEEFTEAIASPGWSPLGEQCRAVEAAGIPIWSEIELAWRLRNRETPWVLVTGTNGKTTTVQMLGSIAEAAGLRHAVVGNVGTAAVSVSAQQLDLLIVEVSSFQLHYTSTLSPVAAVCLNIDDDHLDWHGSAVCYREAKARVYRHVTVACLYPASSAEIEEMVAEADVVEGCRAVGITSGSPAISQLGLVDGILLDRAFLDSRHREAIELADASDLAHLTAGEVPTYLIVNALAAAGLARAAGISPEHVRAGLRSFTLAAHRTHHVATVDGVAYIDDSKATNAHAARAALDGVPAGTAVWIVGGLDKGADLAPLVAQVSPRLRAAVIIGVDQRALVEAFERHAPGIPVTVVPPGDTVMERAVIAAQAHSRPGDSVLLSPACASIDQFRNYADRGDAFADAVTALGR